MSIFKTFFGRMSISLSLVSMALLSSLSLNAAEVERPPSATDLDIWYDLKDDLFNNRPIEENASWLSMKAPIRAEDAAIVPITIIATPQTPGQYFKGLTLIVDNNPVPVAAIFELSPKMGPLHIETRLRVDQYSHIRAIIESSDGKLHMISKYVKASGGCSAPAMKDLNAKMAVLGQSKLRQFTQKPQAKALNQTRKQNQREVQLMVRHPNFSGMQLNQETGYYIPAHYVSDIMVQVDGEQLMKIKGAISLSEDPVIRFRFLSDNKPQVLNMIAKDTKKNEFKNQWQLKPVNSPAS